MPSRQRTGRRLAVIACAIGVILTASVAQAAIWAAPIVKPSAQGVQLAGEVCGPGRKAGPNGVCVPEGWYGASSPAQACPPGMRIGPNGYRCDSN
jgi:hypothetical protein